MAATAREAWVTAAAVQGETAREAVAQARVAEARAEAKAKAEAQARAKAKAKAMTRRAAWAPEAAAAAQLAAGPDTETATATAAGAGEGAGAEGSGTAPESGLPSVAGRRAAESDQVWASSRKASQSAWAGVPARLWARLQASESAAGLAALHAQACQLKACSVMTTLVHVLSIVMWPEGSFQLAVRACWLHGVATGHMFPAQQRSRWAIGTRGRTAASSRRVGPCSVRTHSAVQEAGRRRVRARVAAHAAELARLRLGEARAAAPHRGCAAGDCDNLDARLWDCSSQAARESAIHRGSSARPRHEPLDRGHTACMACR